MVKKRLWLTRRNLLFVVVTTVLVIIGIFLVMQSADKSTQRIPTTSSPSTSDQSSSNSVNTIPASNDKLPASTPTTSSGNSTSTNTTNKNVLTPSGSFVSNHRPSLSGSTEQRQEQSICYTSPGVSCHIEFNKDGQAKVLPTKTTDSSGYAYWTWDIKDAGFSSGAWQIKAIAGSGDQTKTATDSLALEVSQ